MAGVAVFHHIPKCGGTSVNKCLSEWFNLVEDYRRGPDDGAFFSRTVDIDALGEGHCLSGHFAYGDYKLRHRYPDLLVNPRFEVFSFVRDPLQTRVSLYYYQKRRGMNVGSLSDHVLADPNFIASHFDVSENDYEAVLDRYLFIGLVERWYESIVWLGKHFDKPAKEPLLRLNSSERDAQTSALPPQVIATFESINALDYAIYESCSRRFERARRGPND